MSPVELAVRPCAGLADLTFAPRDGRTRLVRSRTAPPLMAGRVLYPDEGLPDLAYLILANPTAGIFAGDRLRIGVRVLPGGRAHLTTQGATRIHAMPGGAARQALRLTVEAGGFLEWLPEATIPFRDARLTQATTLTVAPGGTLIYGDLLAPGRTAFGEELAYTRLRQRLVVRRPDGRLLYQESASLLPGHDALLGRGVLGDEAATLGTLIVVGDELPPEALRDAVRAALPAEGALAGVAVLPGGGGVCVKVLGRGTTAVAGVLRAAWASVRACLLGVGLPPVRKY